MIYKHNTIALPETRRLVLVITARIRRMGMVMFSLCLSVHHSGGTPVSGPMSLLAGYPSFWPRVPSGRWVLQSCHRSCLGVPQPLLVYPPGQDWVPGYPPQPGLGYLPDQNWDTPQGQVILPTVCLVRFPAMGLSSLLAFSILCLLS